MGHYIDVDVSYISIEIPIVAQPFLFGVETLHIFHVLTTTTLHKYRLGDFAVRASVPFTTDANTEKSNTRTMQERVVTYPSVCTSLLIAFATRAAHSPSERLGQAREVHDRERFNGLLAGLFNHIPINTSMEICVDRNAQCFNDTVIGINRTTVPMPRETINTPPPPRPQNPRCMGKLAVGLITKKLGKKEKF